MKRALGLILQGLALAAASPTLAAETVDLRLSGFSKWWVVGQWNQPAYIRAVGGSNDHGDVKGDNEIHFLGSAVLANGAAVGFKAELEAGGHMDQRTDTIDKSFVWVSGRLGKLELGSDYNAASLLHVTAPDAAGLWNGPSMGLMSDMVIARPSAVATMYSSNETGLDHDDNADKVLYFTPDFHGLTLGMSYTPSALSEDDRGPGRANQLYAVGAHYQGQAGPVEVEMSAGGLTGDLSADGLRSTVRALSAGLQLGWGGVTLGGSVSRDRYHTPRPALIVPTSDPSGDAWDVGVEYRHGPVRLSLAHYQSSVRDKVADPRDDRVILTQMSGRYDLGAGIAVLGSAGHIAYRDEAGQGGATENRGIAVMTGLGLWF